MGLFAPWRGAVIEHCNEDGSYRIKFDSNGLVQVLASMSFLDRVQMYHLGHLLSWVEDDSAIKTRIPHTLSTKTTSLS